MFIISFLQFKHNLVWQPNSSIQVPLCSYMEYVWSFSKAFEIDDRDSANSFLLSVSSGFLDLVLLVWESVAFLLMAPVRVLINTSLCSSTSFQDSIILETLRLWVSLSVPYPRSQSSGCGCSPTGLPSTKWLLQTLVFVVTRKSLRLISRSHNLKYFGWGLCT